MQVGMVFALIFTIILIGFVLIVGIPQLGAFASVGSHAQVIKMIHDIDERVESVYYNAGYGSSETITLSLPSGSRICFIDTGQYYSLTAVAGG